MERWVAAVRAGRSVDNLIPVVYFDSANRVEPTTEFSELLAKRLHFIEQELIPEARLKEVR